MLKKIGCKGFSLVELMVGVVILAVILIPLLSAFLTSQKTSNKAKEIRNQTLAAQNVLESYTATDIRTLIGAYLGPELEKKLGNVASIQSIAVYNSATDSYEPVTADTAAELSPGYEIALSGIVAGTKSYDAVLHMDASKYALLNGAEIVDYKTMDAVYIQPDPLNDSGNNPDIIAAKIFAAQAQIDSGTAYDYTHFYDVEKSESRITRKITITISKLGGDTGIISCTALFHYDFQGLLPLYDENGEIVSDDDDPVYIPVHYQTDINNDFFSGGSEADINGMYFFFYPNFSGQSDTIKILNNENVELSIYLIRQSADDDGYSPIIELWESGRGPYDPPVASLHYNYVKKYEEDDYLYIYYYNGESWKRKLPIDIFLVDTLQKNRMYDVTVDLYKAGAAENDFPAEDKLSSFDASSLE